MLVFEMGKKTGKEFGQKRALSGRGTHVGFFHRFTSLDCFLLGCLVLLLLLLMMSILMLALLSYLPDLSVYKTCAPPKLI